jgi:hypothetical protein
MRFFWKGGIWGGGLPEKADWRASRKSPQTHFRNNIQQFGKTGEKIGWHKHPSTAGNRSPHARISVRCSGGAAGKTCQAAT